MSGAQSPVYIVKSKVDIQGPPPPLPVAPATSGQLNPPPAQEVGESAAKDQLMLPKSGCQVVDENAG